MLVFPGENKRKDDSCRLVCRTGTHQRLIYSEFIKKYMYDATKEVIYI